MPNTIYSSARRSGHYNKRKPSGSNRRRAKDYIHPSRFVKVASPIQEVDYTPTHNFTDLAAHPLILANIAAKGFTQPSPIQDKAIPLGLEGRDVIGIANTGTGKTLAFAVVVLHRLLTNNDSKALIIAPTRELAVQIEQECKAIGKGSGLFGALLIGGANMGPQLRDLRAGPRIVIGTPGRIKDHLERKTLDLSKFDTVVLDEVDRMLDMGFINDVSSLLQQLNPARQSFFFSATIDRKVDNLINTFSRNPITVSVKTGDTTDNVHQDIVCYETSAEKIDQLHNLLIRGDITKAIIFDETQRSVERLSKELQSRGFDASDIHGGKTQGQRQRALDGFKSGRVKILVATDVAARGIDVADISHVINYSTPQDFETYSHRIGRAGRAGKTGYALTFITDKY